MTRFSNILSILFTLAAAFYATLAWKIYGHWTGGMPVVLPVILPSLACGLVAAHFLRKWIGPRGLAGLAILAALFAFAALGDATAISREWNLLALRKELSYATWHTFICHKALLWFIPVAVILPFTLRCASKKAATTRFCAMCIGVVLARFAAGRLPTAALLDASLCTLLLAAPLWLATTLKSRWTQSAAFALAALLFVGWYFLSTRPAHDLLRDQHPFASIAARDSAYTGLGSANVALREGRVVRTPGVDEAAHFASQFIATLLKPAPEARIAARTQAGAPALPTYEATALKGLYDALWVELPPAWLAEEADYFGNSALTAALDHLKEDGLLIYALDGRALDTTMLLERIEVLRARLPHTQLWMTSPNHWQIVASRAPITANLEAITNLLDRPTLPAALASVNITAPIFLLPSAFVGDASTLAKALGIEVKAKIPRGEHRAARKLLFDGQGPYRLIRALTPVYEGEMLWVEVDDGAALELRQILRALREARASAMLGDFAPGAKANPSDPYLQSLADRERRAARDLEKLADHARAIEAFARAFALAQPAMADVLEAAHIARTAGKPDKAEGFYNLAKALAPEDPAYRIAYADFLFEVQRYPEAEKLAKQVAMDSHSAPDIAASRFFEARCIAHQPNREKEGLALARFIAETVQAPEEKSRYIPAYGQLLIDLGYFADGLAVKRHFQAYNELLPKAMEKGKVTK